MLNLFFLESMSQESADYQDISILEKLSPILINLVIFGIVFITVFIFSRKSKKNKIKTVEVSFDNSLIENTLLINKYTKDKDGDYFKDLNDKSTVFVIHSQSTSGLILQWKTDIEKNELPEREHEAMYDRCFKAMEESNFKGELVIVDFDAIEYFASYEDVKNGTISIESIIDVLEKTASVAEKYLV